MDTYHNPLTGEVVQAAQPGPGSFNYNGESVQVAGDDWVIVLTGGSVITAADLYFRETYRAGDGASSRKLTPWGFRQRFTFPERVALDNVEGSGLPANVIAAIRTLREDFRAAQVVDLEDANTIAGLDYLEAVGLIAAGRALAIRTV